jgi:hypothetical protein
MIAHEKQALFGTLKERIENAMRPLPPRSSRADAGRAAGVLQQQAAAWWIIQDHSRSLVRLNNDCQLRSV